MSVLLHVRPRLGRPMGNLLYWASANAFSKKANHLPPVTEFEHFEQLRQRKEAFIMDVREPEELTDIGAIPETVNIPLGSVKEYFGLGEKEFLHLTGVRKPALEDPIVAFCMIGKRSATAQKLLEDQLGYSNVSNYLGSFKEWNRKSSQ